MLEDVERARIDRTRDARDRAGFDLEIENGTQALGEQRIIEPVDKKECGLATTLDGSRAGSIIRAKVDIPLGECAFNFEHIQSAPLNVRDKLHAQSIISCVISSFEKSLVQ